MIFPPPLHACGEPHFALRAEAGAWLNFPQNSGQHVEVGVRVGLRVQGVFFLAADTFSVPSGVACCVLYLLPPLLLTPNNPSPPRRGRELQLSLGKGVRSSHTPGPRSPASWLILRLSRLGYQTEPSPDPYPCRYQFRDRAIYILYL